MTKLRITIKSRRNWRGQKRWFVTVEAVANGEVMFTGESNGYNRIAGAQAAVDILRSRAATADVVVLS